MFRFSRLAAPFLAVATLVLLGLTLVVRPAGAVAGADELLFLTRLNQERANHGLPALQLLPALHDLSEDWSNQMLSRRTATSSGLSHRPADQQRAFVEANVTRGWEQIGENVGYGYSVGSLHNAFMNSPTHRANVLGDYDYVGVGSVIDGADGRIYVTFNFLRANLNADVIGVPAPGPAPAPPALDRTTRFNAITPARLLDTRTTGGKPSGAGSQQLVIAGRAGIPADLSKVAAVALNVTATDVESSGFVKVWPTGGAVPGTSNLNTAWGRTVANQVTVPVGVNGAIDLFTSQPAHLVVDVTGWYEPVSSSASGRFVETSPQRLFDSRANGAPRLAGGQLTTLQVEGANGVPATGVSAAVLNVTLTDTAQAGHVTVWGDGAQPPTSNVNADSAGQTVANQVIVPVGRDGNIRLVNNNPTHAIVDLVGWFTDGSAPASTSGLFVPVAPYRAVDTRPMRTRSASTAQWNLNLQGAGWKAAALNVTIVDSGSPGHTVVWGGGSMPATSTVNADRVHQIVPNAATVTGAGDNVISIFTMQESHLVVDVFGFYKS